MSKLVDDEAWLTGIPEEERMEPYIAHGHEMLLALTMCDKHCNVCGTFIHTLNKNYYKSLWAICGTCGHVMEMQNKWQWH